MSPIRNFEGRRGVQRNHEIFVKTALDLESRNIALAIGRKYRGMWYSAGYRTLASWSIQ